MSVTDTGAGIPEDQLNRIFEPFFTTKAVGQGTGLGLSQVFGFAKQSGGEITVENAPSSGAIFTLYLPSVETLAAQGGHAIEAPNSSESRIACVLVVEDNGDVGEFATQALTVLGYRTVLATDARQALAELESDAGRFDVIFSDVVMPGMSGVELGQEVMRLYPGLPIVLASGYSHVLAQDANHGFDLIHKPYSLDELTIVLSKASKQRTHQKVG